VAVKVSKKARIATTGDKETGEIKSSENGKTVVVERNEEMRKEDVFVTVRRKNKRKYRTDEKTIKSWRVKVPQKSFVVSFGETGASGKKGSLGNAGR